MAPQWTQSLGKWLRPAIVVGLLAAVVFAVWLAASSRTGVRRPAPPQTTIALMPPPPPPPPQPPKDQPPEPDKTVSEEPKPLDQPKTAEPPPLTINGPAQAGGDAFGMAAGKGGGMAIGGTGTGEGGLGGAFAESSFRRLLGSEIQQAIQSDDKVNRQVFSAEVAVWLDGAGRLTRAVILRSSGDAKLDTSLVASVQAVGSISQAPPTGVQFPQRVTIRGRRGV